MTRAMKVQPDIAERRLLDYQRTATYLGVSLRAAKEFAKQGEFPKVNLSRRVLFDKADLDAFIERRKRAS